jgi:hypothetical protein
MPRSGRAPVIRQAQVPHAVQSTRELSLQTMRGRDGYSTPVTYLPILATPVFGALIYAVGGRYRSRWLQVLGGTIAVGGPVVWALVIAVTSE